VSLLRGTDWIFKYEFVEYSSTDNLHEQTYLEIVRNHVTKIPFKFYFTNQFSDNEQIKPLGQLHTITTNITPTLPT